jgi:tRNA 2-selenouridine synthase
MIIETVDIEKFLQLSERYPVLDVRSPGEFLQAHMPGALPLPLFTDEQRRIIGTAYKKQSRQAAVKVGLEFFSGRMQLIHEEVEKLISGWQKETGRQGEKNNHVLLHCWRGGMRSGAVAWLLNLYGFKVYTLKGGYKSFRHWVLAQLEKEYQLNILGGYTGSGKTGVLLEMKRKGLAVIDLEDLANHKGSAFGSLGEKPQPRQEMFENLLALELHKVQNAATKANTNGNPYSSSLSPEIWLEDESRHIGSVGIPKPLWEQMRKSRLYFLDISFEERLQQIVIGYGKFDQVGLSNCIMKIQRRLGGLETKNAIKYLAENNLKECFSILLRYYDKHYTSSLGNRENLEKLLNKIPCRNVDVNNLNLFIDTKQAAENLS